VGDNTAGADDRGGRDRFRIGLIASYHLGVASGPAIVLVASLFYILSIFAGRGGMVRRHLPRPHLTG
jgi:zinc/manganese transport system permease protein